MREVNTAAKGTQTELNQIRSALKFDPGNVKLLAQQTAQLGNRVEETKDKLRVLKAQLASMALNQGRHRRVGQASARNHQDRGAA